MCKILTILNTKSSNNKILQDIIDANISGLKAERCGYSILRENKTDFYLGDKDYNNFDVHAKYNGENMFCIHSRTSTGGDRDQKGLHLQRFGNWFWAHNGVVSGLSNVKDYSDSFYFFRALLSNQKIDNPDEKLSKELIETYCKDLSFHGKGFLWNPKTRIFQWFCNSQSYVYLIDGCIIISTFLLILKKEEYTFSSILGYSWISEVKTTDIEVTFHENIDDVILTFWNNKLIQREKLDTTVRTNYRDTPIVGVDPYYGLTKRERKEMKRYEKELNKEKLIGDDGELSWRRDA